MKENNAVCEVCGKGYHVCKTCETNKGTWKSWRLYVDTEDCFKISVILEDLYFNRITADKAKNKLLKCDLSGIDGFNKSIKDKINNLLNTDADEKDKEVKIEEKIEEKVEETKDTKKKKSIASKLSL